MASVLADAVYCAMPRETEWRREEEREREGGTCLRVSRLGGHSELREVCERSTVRFHLPFMVGVTASYQWYRPLLLAARADWIHVQGCLILPSLSFLRGFQVAVSPILSALNCQGKLRDRGGDDPVSQS